MCRPVYAPAAGGIAAQLALLLAFSCLVLTRTAGAPHARPSVLPLQAERVSHTNALPEHIIFDPVAGLVHEPAFRLNDFGAYEPVPTAEPDETSILASLRALNIVAPGDEYAVDSPILTDGVSLEATVERQSTDTIEIRGSKSEYELTLDKNMPDVARRSLEASVLSWADVFPSSVPIRIRGSWSKLEEGTLGATAVSFFIDGAAHPRLEDNAFYVAPLAAAITGKDFLSEDQFHIFMTFNNDTDWHYGETNAPANKTDLESVALHEVCHGLFFFGAMKVSQTRKIANFNFRDNVPTRYGRFVADEDGEGVAACLKPDETYDAFTGDGLRFVDLEDDSVRFRLYSPAKFQRGSSVTHFKEETLKEDCAAVGIPDEECSDLMIHRRLPGTTQRSIGTNTIRVMNSILGDGPGLTKDSCDM